MNKLAERMKLLREELEVGQKELAIYLNCSPGTISNYERGVHEPCLDTVICISLFYGVSLEYLLGVPVRPASADSRYPKISKGYPFSRFLALLDDLLPEERMRLADLLYTMELAHKALTQ